MIGKDKTGVIFMNALLPTIGHKYLIDFAEKFMKFEDSYKLYVIISTRSKEPIAGEVRSCAFREHYMGHVNVLFRHHKDDDAPQNPEDSPNFWEYWADVVEDITGSREHDFVFASEPYGQNVADTLGAEFVPCDIARQIFDVKSTNVREDIEAYYNYILPEMRKHFRQIVTVFGSESTGKTTMSRELHYMHDSVLIPEYAREYLETVGHELTPEKMEAITKGQYSSQKVVYETTSTPYVIQDTDLLSTIGYYRILGWEVPEMLIDAFKATKSSIYLVMNSKIPFEEDILRYGGDRRQSTDQFWIDLLQEFDCEYYVVKKTRKSDQMFEMADVVRNLWTKFDSIAEFERE